MHVLFYMSFEMLQIQVLKYRFLIFISNLEAPPPPSPFLRPQGIVFVLPRELVRRGATISIRWVPGHSGVQGNELADVWATEASNREDKTRSAGGHDSTTRQGTRSLSFFKTQIKKRANMEWREEVTKRSQERRSFRIPREGRIPRTPPGLRNAPKEIASRFFQIASGHAMMAPFLKEKFGWVESDSCWWCGGGKQTREHVLKECRTWKDEIRKLWTEVGEISGTGEKSGGLMESVKDARVSALELERGGEDLVILRLGICC